MGGLRPEQGPPLAVPMSFFLTGPIALAAAGGLVLATSGQGANSIWSGTTVAVVHLGTVGLLLTVMLGALYQMLPVVAGAIVPAVRLAHAVHALVVGGAVCLVYAQAASSSESFAAAFGLLLAGVLLFWIPVALPLARTKAEGPTVTGMRIALLGLASVALLGLRLAYGRAGAGYTEQWVTWRHVHAHIGFLCWVGALISAVSWQVVPMFYLAAAPPRWVTRVTLAGLASSLAALLALFFFGGPGEYVRWAAAPAAIAVWLVQPVWVVVAIRRRRRKRPDPGLRFWWLASASAVAALLAGAAAAWRDDPRWPLVYGYLVLWGWAAAVVHGMLTRIVPFLVWLHRCSALVGLRQVPSTRELLPDRHVALGWWMHLATLGVGLAAIALDRPWSWRALGAAMLATGLHLFVRLLTAVLRAPRLGGASPAGEPRPAIGP